MGARSKDAAGDTLQDSEGRGSDQGEPNKSLSDIENTGQEAAPEDRGKGFGRSLHTVRRETELRLPGLCLSVKFDPVLADSFPFFQGS